MSKVLVQAKQYGIPVQAKYVDELRGTIARLGGGQGIIVSTAEFSPVALASAKASTILPVRLVGGELLARLLIRHRIGVRPGLRVVLTLDEPFFAGLGDRSTANC
jgi:restriction endonuclease Mrr